MGRGEQGDRGGVFYLPNFIGQIIIVGCQSRIQVEESGQVDIAGSQEQLRDSGAEISQEGAASVPPREERDQDTAHSERPASASEPQEEVREQGAIEVPQCQEQRVRRDVTRHAKQRCHSEGRDQIEGRQVQKHVRKRALHQGHQAATSG